MVRLFFFAISLVLVAGIQGCIVFAPPSPFVTLGGPQTTPEAQSEVGIGIGSGAVLFEDAHSGGLGYMLRYKYGVSKRYDLGVDAVGISRSDKGTFSMKVANRYQLSPNWRVEAAVGAADDSDGKSLNGDAAITWGTLPENRSWNLYSSFRLGAAKGYPGNLFGEGEETPPNTVFSMLNLGTQAWITNNSKFVFEGGYGYIFPRGEKAGPAIYVSGGMIFYVGKQSELH